MINTLKILFEKMEPALERIQKIIEFSKDMLELLTKLDTIGCGEDYTITGLQMPRMGDQFSWDSLAR